jgi:altronate hydrolase
MGEIARDHHFCDTYQPTVAAAQTLTFDGIVRSDGRVGTRNYVGILSTVNCSATVARQIAARFSDNVLEAYPGVDGVTALTHSLGCGMASVGGGIEVLRRTMAGYAHHPNFAGMLILGLGCETNQLRPIVEMAGLDLQANLYWFNIQEAGGSAAAVERGAEIVHELLERASGIARVPVPLNRLVVGLQCGGSDGYSGISANPALGAAVDLLVRHGGSALLSETPEIYGAEHLLTARAASPCVADKLMQRLAWWKDYVARNQGEMNNNPSPGNKAGGLTTILEKSLGAVAKAGNSGLMDVLEYAEQARVPGLLFMDSPGYDPVSATGQVASGANLICFTTGRGSVFGCKPAPSLKLGTNTALYTRMRGDIDFNCGAILDGHLTVAEAGEQIFRLMIETASGRPSVSEIQGFGEAEFAPWQIGAVM